MSVYLGTIPLLSGHGSGDALYSQSQEERKRRPESGFCSAHNYARLISSEPRETKLIIYASWNTVNAHERATCPPLLVEKILMVPPHCFTYQRNHRADTSWGSEHGEPSRGPLWESETQEEEEEEEIQQKLGDSIAHRVSSPGRQDTPDE
ncbi:hypothetical protein EYF80_015661 [Liparis tanakae]|uniref:Uncharacterized protein n=1 Tax=Liparis tanakae TaxID=230148 RepID=A0A4Z2I838_9TELE|nr:hypothetical protein EYF80_015661 [Liparis tanakae]